MMGTLSSTNRRWFRFSPRFQFSLRSLIVFITLGGAGLGWLGWWSRQAKQQRETVAEIKREGGRFAYDFEYQHLDRPRYWPTSVVEAYGVDYFANVQDVFLFGGTVTDAKLIRIKSLTSLTSHTIRETSVTDAGLENIKGLKHLEHLDFTDTKVADAGLEHLKNLTALKFLRLYRTNVTDAGLEHFKNLTSLKYLDLTHTKITDAGVARVHESLPDCRIDH